MEIQSHITQNPFYLKTHLYSLTLQHILGTYYVLKTEHLHGIWKIVVNFSHFFHKLIYQKIKENEI